MPGKDVRLETADSTYYYFKVDIFKREITYSTDKSIAANLVTIDAERAFDIMRINKAGEKPLSLKRDGEEEPRTQKYNDILDQDNLNRFDNKKRKKKLKGQKPAQRADRPRDEKQDSASRREENADDKSRRDNNRQRDGRRRQRPQSGNESQPSDASDNRPPRRPDDNNRRERRPGNENRQPRRDNAPRPDGAQAPQQGQPRDTSQPKSIGNEA